MNIEAIRSAHPGILARIEAGYSTPKGMHAETVVGALSALAGECTLRATGEPLPARGWAIAPRVDDFIFIGEESMWPVLRLAAMKSGAVEADLPDPAAVQQRTVAAIGTAAFPVLTIPRTHYPQEYSPLACPKFRDAMETIRTGVGLTFEEMAIAHAVAIGRVMFECRKLIKPEILALLSLEVTMGTARLAPVNMAVKPVF